MSEREFISQFGSWMGTELGVGYPFLQNLEGIVPMSSSLQNCYGKVKYCSDSWSIVCNLYVFSSHVLNSSFLKFHVLMWAYPIYCAGTLMSLFNLMDTYVLQYWEFILFFFPFMITSPLLSPFSFFGLFDSVFSFIFHPIYYFSFLLPYFNF